MTGVGSAERSDRLGISGQLPAVVLRRSSRTPSRQRPACVAADPLLDADAAEADALVEGQAGLVLDEDPRQQRPVPGRLRRRDQGLQQSAPDAPAAPRVRRRTRSPRRRRRRPAATSAGDNAVQPTTVPVADLARRGGISAGASGPSATNPGPRSRRSRRPSRCPRRRSGAPRASPRRPSARSGRAVATV